MRRAPAMSARATKARAGRARETQREASAPRVPMPRRRSPRRRASTPQKAQSSRRATAASETRSAAALRTGTRTRCARRGGRSARAARGGRAGSAAPDRGSRCARQSAAPRQQRSVAAADRFAQGAARIRGSACGGAGRRAERAARRSGAASLAPSRRAWTPPALPAGPRAGAFVDAPPRSGRRLRSDRRRERRRGQAAAQASLTPANGSSRSAAICGAGTAIARPPTRRVQAAIRLEQRNRLERSKHSSPRRGVRAAGACRPCGGAGERQPRVEAVRSAAREFAPDARKICSRRRRFGAGRTRGRRAHARRLATLEAELKSLEQAGENARRAVQDAAEALTALRRCAGARGGLERSAQRGHRSAQPTAKARRRARCVAERSVHARASA